MIAKVEPLTTARALRGPFDYRLGERFGDVGVGSVLLVPFGRQRLRGVVTVSPRHRILRPSAWRSRSLCSARRCRRRWSSLASGLAANTAQRPRGDSSWCWRPEAARGWRQGSARAACRADPGGQRRARRFRAAGAQAAICPREIGRCRRAGSAGTDRDALKRLEKRGLVTLSETEVSRRPDSVAVGVSP